jgi:predicted nucleic acid-binding protein
LEVILDTNALSAIGEAEPRAVAAFSQAQSIAIPVVVLGEFLFGIAQSRRRVEYERWISHVLRTFRVLDIGVETAAKYAQVRMELKRASTPIPSNDMWIVALCRQHSLPLLSRDRRFESVNGLRRVGW